MEKHYRNSKMVRIKNNIMTRTPYHRPTTIELKRELEYIENTIDAYLLADNPKQNWWFLSNEFNTMLRRRNLLQPLCG